MGTTRGGGLAHHLDVIFISVVLTRVFTLYYVSLHNDTHHSNHHEDASVRAYPAAFVLDW
jgi:hypothetical protein